MGSRYTQSFKIQAVEKALSRTESTNLKEKAQALGIGYSTLEKWIDKAEIRNLNHFLIMK